MAGPVPSAPKAALAPAPQRGRAGGLIRTPPAGLRCTLPSFNFPAERWRHPQGGKGVSSPSCAHPGEGKSIGKTPPAPESPHPSCQNGFLQGGCGAGGVILLWGGCGDPLRLCPLHQGVLGTGVWRGGRYNRGDPGSCLVGTWGTTGMGPRSIRGWEVRCKAAPGHRQHAAGHGKAKLGRGMDQLLQESSSGLRAPCAHRDGGFTPGKHPREARGSPGLDRAQGSPGSPPVPKCPWPGHDAEHHQLWGSLQPQVGGG